MRTAPLYSWPSRDVCDCAMLGEQGLCSCENKETTATTGPSHLWEGGVEERGCTFQLVSQGSLASPGSREGQGGGLGLALPEKGLMGKVQCYLQGWSRAPPWLLKSLCKRRPCSEVFRGLQCAPLTSHTI